MNIGLKIVLLNLSVEERCYIRLMYKKMRRAGFQRRVVKMHFTIIVVASRSYYYAEMNDRYKMVPK